jgi:hypothetical protein
MGWPIQTLARQGAAVASDSMDSAEMSKPLKLTPIQGVTLVLVYSFGTVFLGTALAIGSSHFLYQAYFRLGRPLIGAATCAIAMLVCWITMPTNRPRFGALVLRVAMMWALVIGSIILHHRLVYERLATQEVAILGTAAALFLTGVFISRRTSWGKRWLYRG